MISILIWWLLKVGFQIVRILTSWKELNFGDYESPNLLIHIHILLPISVYYCAEVFFFSSNPFSPRVTVFCISSKHYSNSFFAPLRLHKTKINSSYLGLREESVVLVHLWDTSPRKPFTVYFLKVFSALCVCVCVCVSVCVCCTNWMDQTKTCKVVSMTTHSFPLTYRATAKPSQTWYNVVCFGKCMLLSVLQIRRRSQQDCRLFLINCETLTLPEAE